MYRSRSPLVFHDSVVVVVVVESKARVFLIGFCSLSLSFSFCAVSRPGRRLDGNGHVERFAPGRGHCGGRGHVHVRQASFFYLAYDNYFSEECPRNRRLLDAYRAARAFQQNRTCCSVLVCYIFMSLLFLERSKREKSIILPRVRLDSSLFFSFLFSCSIRAALDVSGGFHPPPSPRPLPYDRVALATREPIGIPTAKSPVVIPHVSKA